MKDRYKKMIATVFMLYNLHLNSLAQARHSYFYFDETISSVVDHISGYKSHELLSSTEMQYQSKPRYATLGQATDLGLLGSYISKELLTDLAQHFDAYFDELLLANENRLHDMIHAYCKERNEDWGPDVVASATVLTYLKRMMRLRRMVEELVSGVQINEFGVAYSYEHPPLNKSSKLATNIFWQNNQIREAMLIYHDFERYPRGVFLKYFSNIVSTHKSTLSIDKRSEYLTKLAIVFYMKWFDTEEGWSDFNEHFDLIGSWLQTNNKLGKYAYLSETLSFIECNLLDDFSFLDIAKRMLFRVYKELSGQDYQESLPQFLGRFLKKLCHI